ncbi:MAG: hypothetical protein JRJ84_25470, partial [Deltaproteobacteria bacterium]|nr:hypothetical protein [Deltaproteobacteria bacterium]
MRRLLPLTAMLLLVGCPPFIWSASHRQDTGEGRDGEVTWQVLFWPNLDVGVCGGPTWCCETVAADDEGQFEEVWAPGYPDTLHVEGFVLEEGFLAMLECFEREGPAGQIAAERVDLHYQGEFAFGPSFGAAMVIPFESDTVTLQGMAYDSWRDMNIQGARVTASVDPDSDAFTNQAGMFYLKTEAPTEYGQTPYTITIEA